MEEDFPATSTLDNGLLESVGDWKLAFDRRRSCLRNGMATVSKVKPGTSHQEKNRLSWGVSLEGGRAAAVIGRVACQEQESATVCGG